jgi:hypothetical protein
LKHKIIEKLTAASSSSFLPTLIHPFSAKLSFYLFMPKDFTFPGKHLRFLIGKDSPASPSMCEIFYCRVSFYDCISFEKGKKGPANLAPLACSPINSFFIASLTENEQKKFE